MFLAGKPETDAESNFMGACAAALTAPTASQSKPHTLALKIRFRV
jgi:hypothetical protein